MAIIEFFENDGYIYPNGKIILKEETDVLLRDELCQYLTTYTRLKVSQI